MKKLFFFGLIFFSLAAVTSQIAAQNAAHNILDTDLDSIDSLFDKPLSDDDATVIAEPKKEKTETSVLGNVRRRGLSVTASYEFQGIAAPGWDMRPWEFNGDEAFKWGQGVKMGSTVKITAQLSEFFRVLTNISFNIPGFSFVLDDFFFDYNIVNKVFIRAGKYEQSWGISPNFGFTNLLSRVPNIGPSGQSYLVKADIPVGIGGIQALALTRADINGGAEVHRSLIGFGGKFNLALRLVDLDMGVFYQDFMATRGIFSIKTTILNTELYNEWLVAANTHSDNAVSYALNFGFSKNFFSDKLELNGEIFYNGEGNTYFYSPETDLREAETTPFIEGLNIALNLLFRFDMKGSPRFFAQALYAPMQESLRLVPGFKLNPFPHIEAYIAVPMALGRKDGYYYQHTYDNLNRPFSVMFYVTISGNVNAGYYY